jgi:hypothetical protein
MTMMGGPIDPRNSPTQVNNLATEKNSHGSKTPLSTTSLPTIRAMAARSIRAFAAHRLCGNESGRHAQSHWDYYQNLIKGDDESAEQHRKFYDEYNAVLDLPAEYYLETIKTVFQEFRLPRGTWKSRENWFVRRILKLWRCSRSKVSWTISPALVDTSGPQYLQQHSCQHETRLCGTGLRSLRYFLRSPLARTDLPENRRIHPETPLISAIISLKQ